MTVTQTLRMSDILAARLDRIANETDRSRHQVVIDTLVDEHLPDAAEILDPDLVAGYVEVFGGVVVGADCPECGQPMHRPHIGFTVGATGPQAFGPVCEICATTD